MKKLETWKKVLLIICTVLVILRIGYIAFRGEVDKEYYLSTQYDLSEAVPISCSGAVQTFISNESRLNSLEFIFTDIADDKEGYIIVQIISNDELMYQTNISLSNLNNMEWKKVYVNAAMSADKVYKIVFTPSETCTQIPNLLLVKNVEHASEIQQSVSAEQILDGQIAINYGYLRSPGYLDRLVMISLWVLLWLIVGRFLIKFDIIRNYVKKGAEYLKQQVKSQVLVTVLEIIGCFIIINSSGIEFQAPTQVIFYLISFIATINYSKKFECVNGIAVKGWKRTLLILLYIYSAFSLVGQRIFIYPLTIKLTVAGLFVFVCTVLWFVLVINSCIYYLEKLSKKGFSIDKKMKTWQFIIISIVLLIVPAAYNLFANNPGISSPDTIACMIKQAQHLHGSANWHPAFYCMVLRVIQLIWNSTYAVIMVQYFFWLYVCIELTLYLRKKEVKESILIILTLFLGSNAGNYIHINTIWKDIPYTLSIFWSLIILTKLLVDYEEYYKKWYIYLELIVSLIGLSLYRNNGIVPFIIIIVLLIITLRKNIKVWISVAVSISLFAFIKGPIYTYFEIQPIESGMYIGLSQDILGVYYAGGEVSEKTLQMINIMTGKNNAEYSYNPTWSNQSYDLAVNTKEFVFNYIDTFIKNPIVMIRAIIDREDAVWDIYAGQDSVLGCVNYIGTMDSDVTWSENYEARKFVSLYNQATAASSYTVSSQWISAIEWRCGLFTLLGIISVLYMFWIRRKMKYLLLLSPNIGHILSLLLSTGWSDFRYFWPLNLMNLSLIFIVLVITQKGEEENCV